MARAACALLAAAAFGGCAPLGGGAGAAGSSGAGAAGSSAGAPASTAGEPGSPAGVATAAKVTQAGATHEVPTPLPPAETPAPGGAAPSAAAAVRAFATAYINWSAGSVKDDLLRLAALSVGQARSAMTLAAAQTAGDYELHQGGIGNRGSVEAVAPLSGHAGQYVVVTREQTTATKTTAYAGLRPAWHVTIATVRRLASGGWVVSGWQPES